MAYCFAIMAGIAARREPGGRRAATLIGVTETLLEATATKLWISQHRIYEQVASATRERLGPEQFEAARREGHALTIEAAVVYALSDSDGPAMPSPSRTWPEGG